MRRGALDVDGDREPLTIGDGHDLRALAALRLPDAASSLLGAREAAINECLLHIEVTFVVKHLGKDGEDVFQHAAPHPLLKSPMAGLVRRVAVWQLRPRSAGSQDPQD